MTDQKVCGACPMDVPPHYEDECEDFNRVLIEWAREDMSL